MTLQEIQSATDALPVIALQDHLRARIGHYLGDNPDSAGKLWAIIEDGAGNRVKIDLSESPTNRKDCTMAIKKQKVTSTEPNEAGPSFTVQATDGLGNLIGGSNSTRIPKDIEDLWFDLNETWDAIKALGRDPEHEFMHVINAKLTGKSLDEVKAITEKAQQKESELQRGADESETDWQKRKEAYDKRNADIVAQNNLRKGIKPQQS
jgi:hypothetical protein